MTAAAQIRLGWRILGDRRPGGVRGFLAAARSADRRGLLVLSVISVVLPIVTSGTAFATKLVADGLVRHDTRAAVIGTVLVVLGSAVPRVLSQYQNMRTATLQERTGVRIRQQINAMTSSIPGIEHHERPEYQDQLALLRAGVGQVVQGAFLIFDVLSALVQVVVTAVLLSRVSPILLLIAPLGLLPFLSAILSERRGMLAALAASEPQRKATGLYEMMRLRAASEVRVFRTQPFLAEHVAGLRRAANRTLFRAEAITQLQSSLANVVLTLGQVASVIYVARLAAQGGATTGDVVLTAVLAARLADSFVSLAGQLQKVLAFLRAAGRFTWLAEYVEEASRRALPMAPTPAVLRQGIRLQHVAFVYPGTAAEVLTDVDAWLPAGATIALVGDNGAGKTTLVKLLCGFYAPTRGRILIDGTDLQALEPREWRTRTTACFQDHLKPELVALHAVGTGDPVRVDAEPDVRRAVRRAAADHVIAKLVRGYGTQLGRSFGNGTDLSGGQWQQLALARSLMRDLPLLILLDEPTAALDPEAEHNLFASYTRAAREASAATGAVTLLVSHRFSTVRMADLILVIEDGQVAEQGTHEELVALGGRYSAMYDVQARAYR